MFEWKPWWKNDACVAEEIWVCLSEQVQIRCLFGIYEPSRSHCMEKNQWSFLEQSNSSKTEADAKENRMDNFFTDTQLQIVQFLLRRRRKNLGLYSRIKKFEPRHETRLEADSGFFGLSEIWIKDQIKNNFLHFFFCSFKVSNWHQERKNITSSYGERWVSILKWNQ